MKHDKLSLRVFFFGDSVCFGQGVSIHKGWVTRISAETASLSSALGRSIVVINASVNGNTTRQALERMPYDVQSQNADLLIVQLGMNDCNCWESDRGHPRVSPMAFEANLHEIVSRAFVFGVRRVLLHTNHPTTRNRQAMTVSAITYEESNRRYNEIIRRVARKRGRTEEVILVDVENAFRRAVGRHAGRLPDLLQPDGLHLSEKGHDLYFQTVYPVVNGCIHELARAHPRRRT